MTHKLNHQPWMVEAGTTFETKAGDTTNTTTPFTSICKIIGMVNLTTRYAMGSLRRLWIDYYPQGAFGEEGMIMPGSTLSLIVGGLLNFVEIKSQGQAEFPFKTHPGVVKVTIASLLMYGLASGVEHAISAASSGRA